MTVWLGKIDPEHLSIDDVRLVKEPRLFVTDVPVEYLAYFKLKV